MPELPEVETLRRQLEPLLAGQPILAVQTDGSRGYAGAQDAAGATITRLDRRGKYLLARLGVDRELVLHLGMTGQLLWQGAGTHERVRLSVPAGDLVLRDPRGFGRAGVVTAGQYGRFPTLNALGPDPLAEDFDLARFARALSQASGELKGVLLAQRIVAGVGNYLADETCWHAGVHPRQRHLTVRRARRVGQALTGAIAASLAAGGVSERDYVHVDGSRGSYAEQLSCYGRAGQPCLRCGRPLEKSVVAGRGTTWCPRCQRLRLG